MQYAQKKWVQCALCILSLFWRAGTVLTTSELTYISQSLPDSSTQMMAWLAPSEFWVCAVNYTREKQIDRDRERERKRERINLLPYNNLNFHIQNLMPKTPPSSSFTRQSLHTSPSLLLPTPHLSSKIWAWSSRMLQFKSHFLELLILLHFYNHTSHQARILGHNNSSFFFYYLLRAGVKDQRSWVKRTNFISFISKWIWWSQAVMHSVLSFVSSITALSWSEPLLNDSFICLFIVQK